MDRRTLLKGLGALGLATGVAPLACARRGSALPFNVIWIVVDTLRADRLGCYGGTPATPNIDALAQRGVRFEWAYCHAPMTLPSHAAMFSSRYPFEIGARTNGDVVTDQAMLFAESFTAAAGHSLGVTSLGTVSSRFGLAQGFEVYRESMETVPCVAEETCERLAGEGERIERSDPLLLFLHLADPHEPYRSHGTAEQWVEVFLDDAPVARADISSDPRVKVRGLREGRNLVRIASDSPVGLQTVTFHPQTSEWRALDGLGPAEVGLGRVEGEATLEILNTTPTSRRAQFSLRFRELLTHAQIRDRYALEVEYVDRQLGEALATLDELGVLEGALVVLTADHGEGLGEHGVIGHAVAVYEGQLRIPLILSQPGTLPEGLVVPSRVRHLDLVPTLCPLLGLPTPGGIRGRDLMPLIRGEEASDRPVLSATFRPEARENLAALIEGEYKLIRHMDNGQVELYRPRTDPAESTDLAATSTDVAERLGARLEELRAETGFPTDEELAAPSGGRTVDDQTREMLEALGYLSDD